MVLLCFVAAVGRGVLGAGSGSGSGCRVGWRGAGGGGGLIDILWKFGHLPNIS